MNSYAEGFRVTACALGDIAKRGRDTLMQCLKRLLLGSGRPDPMYRQGYRRLGRLLSLEWRQGDAFGTVRVLRLLLLGATYLFPVVLLDTIADRLIQRCSRRPHLKYVDIRIVAIYREFYFFARCSFLVCELVLAWYSAAWSAIVSAYVILEIAHAWLGRALAWGRHSIKPSRSLALAILNYGEVTLAFAILYLYCECLNVPTPTPTQAVYFSFVTAATVGFGDIHPRECGYGYHVVIAQIVVFLVFVVFVVSTLASRLPEETRPRRPYHLA